MNALDLLKKDHDVVKELFGRFDSAQNGQRQQILDQIIRELEVHSRVEQDIFYPAVRAHADKSGKNLVKEAMDEHQEVDGVIAELRELSPDDAEFEDKIEELMEDVENHIDMEETQMFPKAQALGPELETLGREIEQEKQTLEPR
jgi:iron-sulfur cluster repair protein YtfE (RIC family)